jgi:cystathionine beta-lyase/cystathionine gamma-synthase
VVGKKAGPFFAYPTKAAPIAAAPGGGLKVSSISCVYTPGDTNTSAIYFLHKKLKKYFKIFSFYFSSSNNQAKAIYNSVYALVAKFSYSTYVKT